MQPTSTAWELVCHTDFGQSGQINIIRENGQKFSTMTLAASAPSNAASDRKPVFFGVENQQAIIMDAESKVVSRLSDVPPDHFPSYAYRDDEHQRIWFTNDGDKASGNDTLNCGENGSSVTIVKRDNSAKVLKTLCVGRGHHVTTFVSPSTEFPNMPKRAFVSNLLDGTVTIVGNDESNADEFLNIIAVINLCEASKEDGQTDLVPNNAFPHGMVFSKITGKLYNLNNGYGTVAVIDPVSMQIENTFTLKGCSNLLDSPCGNFLIGKGADRKSNAEHVIGKLAVLDVKTGEEITNLALEDYYPSVYRFSKDGKKLYVTSAGTGKGIQKENLVMDTVQIYDATALPALTLQKTVTVGKAECGRRPIAFASQGTNTSHTFIPNPTDGTMTILDSNDNIIDTIEIAAPNANELLFSFWGEGIWGA